MSQPRSVPVRGRIVAFAGVLAVSAGTAQANIIANHSHRYIDSSASR